MNNGVQCIGVFRTFEINLQLSILANRNQVHDLGVIHST